MVGAGYMGDQYQARAERRYVVRIDDAPQNYKWREPKGAAVTAGVVIMSNYDCLSVILLRFCKAPTCTDKYLNIISGKDPTRNDIWTFST